MFAFPFNDVTILEYIYQQHLIGFTCFRLFPFFFSLPFHLNRFDATFYFVLFVMLYAYYEIGFLLIFGNKFSIFSTSSMQCLCIFKRFVRAYLSLKSFCTCKIFLSQSMAFICSSKRKMDVPCDFGLRNTICFHLWTQSSGISGSCSQKKLI